MIVNVEIITNYQSQVRVLQLVQAISQTHQFLEFMSQAASEGLGLARVSISSLEQVRDHF